MAPALPPPLIHSAHYLSANKFSTHYTRTHPRPSPTHIHRAQFDPKPRQPHTPSASYRPSTSPPYPFTTTRTVGSSRKTCYPSGYRTASSTPASLWDDAQYGGRTLRRVKGCVELHVLYRAHK
ncbi:hypothetical protein M011DRAFT_470044 [Sporormia fimetaria CBS 119925]|uniref:Uncharacterized protein n=1 Tax=Sporormia fimetaria CBS 119925 TaxID=1340428 RepID=A0A6A6V371_9PLEO|nr:hypothetical protein M011DRAFT_470044 [Sporormia fimetaria CBS 119925]